MSGRVATTLPSCIHFINFLWWGPENLDDDDDDDEDDDGDDDKSWTG